jgi:hypothetical protein
LDIVIHNCKNQDDGEIRKWQEVLIYSEHEGLRNFVRLLITIADLHQEKESETELSVGARPGYHLRPNRELVKSPVQTIAGRLGAQGTGYFYDRYIAKNKKMT